MATTTLSQSSSSSSQSNQLDKDEKLAQLVADWKASSKKNRQFERIKRMFTSNHKKPSDYRVEDFYPKIPKEYLESTSKESTIADDPKRKSLSKRKLELDTLAGNLNSYDTQNKENDSLLNQNKDKNTLMNTSNVTQKLPLGPLPTASKSPSPLKNTLNVSKTITNAKKLDSIAEVPSHVNNTKSLNSKYILGKNLISDDEEIEDEKQRKALVDNKQTLNSLSDRSPVLNSSSTKRITRFDSEQLSANNKQKSDMNSDEQCELDEMELQTLKQPKILREIKNKLHSTYIDSPKNKTQKTARLNQLKQNNATASPTQQAFNDSIRRKSTNLSIMTNDIDMMNEAPFEDENDEIVVGSGDFYEAAVTSSKQNQTKTFNKTKESEKESENANKVYSFSKNAYQESFTNLKEVKASKSSIKISKIQENKNKESKKKDDDKEEDENEVFVAPPPPPPPAPSMSELAQPTNDELPPSNQSQYSTLSQPSCSNQPLKEIEVDLTKTKSRSMSIKAGPLKSWLQKADEINNSTDERELAAIQSSKFIRRSQTSNKTANNTTTLANSNFLQASSITSALLSKSKVNRLPPSTSFVLPTPVVADKSNKESKVKKINLEKSPQSPQKHLKNLKEKESKIREREEESNAQSCSSSNSTRSSRSRTKKSSQAPASSNQNIPTSQQQANFEIFNDNSPQNSSPVSAKRSKLSEKTNTQKESHKQAASNTSNKKEKSKDIQNKENKRQVIENLNEQAEGPRRSKRVKHDHKIKAVYDYEKVSGFKGETIMVRRLVATEKYHDAFESFVYNHFQHKEIKKQQQKKRSRKQKRAASSSKSPQKKPTSSQIKNKKLRKEAAKTVDEHQQSADIVTTPPGDLSSSNDEEEQVEIVVEPNYKDNNNINNNITDSNNNQIVQSQTPDESQNTLSISVDEHNISQNSRINASQENIIFDCGADEASHQNNLVQKNMYCYKKKCDERVYEEISDGVYIHAQSKDRGVIKIESNKALKTHFHADSSVTYVIQKGLVVFSINGILSRHTDSDIVEIPNGLHYKVKNVSSKENSFLYFKFAKMAQN